MFKFAEESGESKNRREMRDRDRMIDYLLEELGLDPAASDADLFERAQELGGPRAYIVTYATRKAKGLERG
eukprot:7575430-Alexandrium_andersonii.AAC.1